MTGAVVVKGSPDQSGTELFQCMKVPSGRK